MNTATVPSPTSSPSPVDAQLHGVNHTARPTWKLRETMAFYRDVMGLKLIHLISAKGWGRDGHPDFLHFFFDSGRGSTIAFFYYLGTDRPERIAPFDSWFYRATHTAWNVETREELLAWKARFELHDIPVRQIRHEIIESIYVVDPNGYSIEVTWNAREPGVLDARDAEMTIAAAIELEDRAGSVRGIATIDNVWRRKAELVDERAARE